MIRCILRKTVKKLNTFLRYKSITFSAPNKKGHKTVHYLNIRPNHKVRHRSMHKHSYRYFDGDVHFREM